MAINKKIKAAKHDKLTLRHKRAIVGLLFISPWFLGFLIYYVRSLFITISFSLSKINIAESGGYTSQFIGLNNFKYALFQDANFNQLFVNSIIDILIDVPFIIFFSLFIALLLNSKFRGRGLVRAIFFLPILLGSGAVANTLLLATQNIQGGAGAVASEMSGISGVNIDYFLSIFTDLGLPDKLLDYIVDLIGRIFDIVRASSVQIIIFIAALQSVPHSLYEVSNIEGATTYETFWKVTFPMVSPLILTNVVYTIVDSFVGSLVVDTAYEAAFVNYNYGLSSAMSILSTAVVCVILVTVGTILTRKTFYYN
ncbi:lactose ABC transporter permease [Anaerocolumna cellulosilytica]|uniref:Lactose ABC transporter permease n=1 Tax=Anaerocolumna cellulosilytica TaxID=433286 RepID=A0A6S6QT92_9FIRM|nr:sugar ABC transporter permease [Anaerocolumna cellulosilytica]MBB5194244.1 ABC-type sugar transport system permease subunit [Anaerocolumna cellulosilytica]BCJ94543.1 lactose ABC transporter permease [Anaerocolumna cellulosilytica]